MVRKKDPVGIDIDALYDTVMIAMVNHDKWNTNAYQYGSISPVQFLAIMVFRISQGNCTPEKSKKIIENWWTALKNATVRRCATLGVHGPYRIIYPKDSDTLLELKEVTSYEGWCMNIDEVHYWLANYHGLAALITHYFESVGLVDAAPAIQLANSNSANAVPESESDQNPRKKVKGVPWEPEQLDLLYKDYQESIDEGHSPMDSYGAVAKRWGDVDIGTVKQQVLKIKKENAPKQANAFTSVVRNLPVSR